MQRMSTGRSMSTPLIRRLVQHKQPSDSIFLSSLMNMVPSRSISSTFAKVTSACPHRSLIELHFHLDQNNSVSTPFPNGTYNQASSNSSIDYLALQIILIPSPFTGIPAFWFIDDSSNATDGNITFALGQDKSCAANASTSSRCNGPLRSGTAYK